MKEKLKILVVDDEEPIREVMKTFLEYEGRYGVLVAKDGFEALQIIARERVDCCFTDISMPGMDGLELTRRIQALDNTIPVVVVTGYPSMDTAIKTLQNGVVDFLVKPIKMDHLVMLVEKTMRQRGVFVENLFLKEELKGKQRILELNRQLNEKVRELETVNRILRRLDQPSSSKALFSTLVHLCGEVTSCDEAHFCVLDQDMQEPTIISSFFGQDASSLATPTSLPKDILKKMAAEGIPILVKGSKGEGSCIAAPLKIRSSLFGALVLKGPKGNGHLREQDLYYLSFLLDKASSSIENFALYENLYGNLFSILYAFVETLEARDSYTKQHSARVTEYAATLARHLGCSDEDMAVLHVAGYLHDIGKIGIPDHILLKPDRLTGEEFMAIKKHPLIGSNIVGHFDIWQKEQSVIKHHHERWDGRGYPEGLGMEAIPYLARIVALADTYDALTSNRSYRSKMPAEKALAIIRENAGTQFDPNIASVFLNVFDRGEEALKEPILAGLHTHEGAYEKASEI